jgi:polyhydroxyalkanoate synthase
MFQAGQAFAQGLMSFLAQPQGAQTPFPSALPENEEIARLRQEFAGLHAALWQSMLQRKPGEAVPSVIAADNGDKRFAAQEWADSPYFDYLRQAYLINAGFLKKLADALPIDDAATKNRLRFATRQYVDALAPSNFAATNPEFIRKALETQGASITAGINNLIGDLHKGRVSMTDDTAFEVGRNLAVTPGQVVYENELFQLLQYAPATARVFERPLLMVPPCINKYYILDLQPENSFVRHAVEQGMTVFLVSWRNPQPDLGHLGWDDYIEKGALQAIAVARAICGSERINALGFCVGGTILTAALAVARARGEDPVESLTLLTTLLDFSDGGDIVNFVDKASVARREAEIGKGGLLRGAELAAAFSALRANDLIWQYVVGNYLKGGSPQAFDLLYWNADSTNLPGPFAAWYLRKLYLDNGLRVPGKLVMCGVAADLGRLDMPAYVYASREDHIVPWRTAYLSRGILGGETTFVMGASGHIAGVINPPAKGKRSHWRNDETAATAEEWLAGATEHKGSWWPHWMEWLKRFSGGECAAPKKLGNRKFKPIEPAPGRYVKEKA